LGDPPPSLVDPPPSLGDPLPHWGDPSPRRPEPSPNSGAVPSIHSASPLNRSDRRPQEARRRNPERTSGTVVLERPLLRRLGLSPGHDSLVPEAQLGIVLGAMEERHHPSRQLHGCCLPLGGVAEETERGQGLPFDFLRAENPQHLVR
jgi:hypothetical protein